MTRGAHARKPWSEIMKATITNVFLTACLVFGVASAANAAIVTFSDFVSGNGNDLLFDPGQTVPVGNDLHIGITAFFSDGRIDASLSSVDSLSVMVTAPDGYVITSIDYTESGSGFATNGIATASGSLVADNIPTNFVTETIVPNDSRLWDITLDTILIDNKQSIAVSITNSLFAYSFAPGEQAFIEKTEATLTVGITAVPLPAAAWLFGSAMLGLMGVARRRKA
jgi:hypothetical protein